MTDYGQGPSSEPWYPDDPLFGDAHDHGQGYPHPAQDPQEPYPAQWQNTQSPQPGHPQQVDYNQYWTGSHPLDGHPQQDPYNPPDPYALNGYPPAQQPQFQQHPSPAQQSGPPHGGQAYSPRIPNGQYPQSPSAREDHVPGHIVGQSTRSGEPVQWPHRSQESAPEPFQGEPEDTGSWSPDAVEGYGDETVQNEDDRRGRSLFADRADSDDGPSTLAVGGRRSARTQKRPPRKRRGGCVVLLVVLVGGVGGVGYIGHNMYQNHFGPPPDYSGQGSVDVQVEIPKAASAAAMGNILKKAGVVKSVDAFIEATNKNKKGLSVQAGVYILKAQMPAAAALTMMLDPKSQNAMIIPEGWRASRIYQEIDTKLGLKAGSTAVQVKDANLSLPAWAKGNLEGLLFPGKYGVTKDEEPVDLVKQMVDQAKAEYAKDGIADSAAKVGRSPREILVVASLVQAEAQELEDFGKVSRVIYNRLDSGMALGFDSTLNYAMGRSTLNTSIKDTHFTSPYNTYDNKGLPPGPIDNPGRIAINAALNPTPGKWLYFVTVKPGDTRFAESFAEHQINVSAFNAYQREHG
ncbi:endolytic transglycosylase MltG [Streptomyces sp. NPDC096057]|uniref:endolytic transglycosylase MltG n=1 Tax=Streptomyces sp. NPDC096057 TaxID=3155543 RepID=UPI00332FD463